ncbi:hypothetical protein L596_012815 [Steinernema carpocapsae]|uniref:Uncharacterized protein n=1 Tax=Steinernema carpocapsae TaxID=34508 RepID=A0A4U5NY81_STECR|nr:hypothetical protein L596_012815 [Steinernema carpocapsae]
MWHLKHGGALIERVSLNGKEAVKQLNGTGRNSPEEPTGSENWSLLAIASIQQRILSRQRVPAWHPSS